MPNDLNAPAERAPNTKEKPAEFDSQKAGRYQLKNPATVENVADQTKSSVANRYVKKAALEPAAEDAIDWDAPTTRGRSKGVSELPAERQNGPENLDPQGQRSASAPADPALQTPPPPLPSSDPTLQTPPPPLPLSEAPELPPALPSSDPTLETPPPPLPSSEVPELVQTRGRSANVLKPETSERENNPDVARQYSLESQIRQNDMQLEKNNENLKNTIPLNFESDKATMIKALFDDPEGRDILRNHLRSEFSTENLQLLEANEKFKKDAPNQSDAELLQAAKEINAKYVLEGSPLEVNIAQNERYFAAEQIANAEANGTRLDAKLFDKAEGTVLVLTGGDSLMRLKMKEEFENWKINSVETFEAKRESLIEQNKELEKKNESLRSQSAAARLENDLEDKMSKIDKDIAVLDKKLSAVEPVTSTVWSDPAMREALEKFADDSRTNENTNFLKALDEYENAPPDADPILLKRMADAINSNYIKEGSDNQVNLQTAERTKITKKFEVQNDDDAIVDRKIFIEPRAEVELLIGTNDISRLMKNPDGKFKALNEESKRAFREQKQALVEEREVLMEAYRAARLRAVKAERSQTS